jgi:hypothetical protein
MDIILSVPTGQGGVNVTELEAVNEYWYDEIRQYIGA